MQSMRAYLIPLGIIMLTVCYEGTMRIDVAAFVLKVNLAC